MSRVVLKWFELRWPREVDSERLVSVFRMLAGSKVAPVVIEAVGIDRGVVHRLALPEAASPMLLAQMRAALPAIGFVKLEDRPPVEIDREKIEQAKARFFTGNPTDKAMWLLIGGAVAAVAGLVGVLHSSKS